MGEGKIAMDAKDPIIEETPAVEEVTQADAEAQPVEDVEATPATEEGAQDTQENPEKEPKPVLPTLDESEPKAKEVEPGNADEDTAAPSMDAIMDEIAQLALKDEITDEDLAKFEEKGYDPNMVSLAIKGVKAELQEASSKLYEAVGGQEQWTQIAEWANANLSPEEKTSFNKIMASGDINAAKLALLGLKNYYEASNSEPTVLTGTSDATPGIKPFNSQREYVEALKDPRYKKDPAYRAEVDKRFEHSVRLGKL